MAYKNLTNLGLASRHDHYNGCYQRWLLEGNGKQTVELKTNVLLSIYLIFRPTLSLYNKVALLLLHHNSFTWTQTFVVFGAFAATTKVLLGRTGSCFPVVPYLSILFDFFSSRSPSWPLLLGDVWHNHTQPSLYKYTPHGYCALQQGGERYPCEHVLAVYFLPRSALPVPADLLTNRPDYATVRRGMPIAKHSHCEVSPLTAPDWMHIWTRLGRFESKSQWDRV